MKHKQKAFELAFSYQFCECLNAYVFFQAIPVTAAGVPVSDQPFTRTGLLGFVGPVSVSDPPGALCCPDSQL